MAIEGQAVADIFSAFGGATKLARATGVPVTTVDSWRRKQCIPSWRWSVIVEGAREAGVELPPVENPPEAA